MVMERKLFLKSLFVGATSAVILGESCKKEDIESTTTTGITSGGTNNSGTSGNCTLAPSETEGPYPTKSPSAYQRNDIREDRSGYKMEAKITITNKNNNCAALAGAIVDIWHCDAEGNYSEYGGSGSQGTNYQAVHFLRGRQVSDANGLVSFTTIFPGWYTGRATHIHVHIFSASGVSLKVTQIAFPEGSGSALLAVGGYKKGMSGYSYNASDNVFSDGVATQLANVSGNTTDGFILSINLAVSA